MTSPTPPAAAASRRFIRQLADGDSIDNVFLVGEKLLRNNRQGNPFLQVELRDRSGSIVGRLWNASEQLFRQFESGDFIQARGKVQMYQGALQVILSSVTPLARDAQQLNPADFLPQTDQDLARLQERLRTHLLKLSNHHLQALAQAFLMDEAFMQAFSWVPAGVRNHHAYVGGLLEHVVHLLEGADRLLALYPALDRDQVLMGLFLHDIGKVRELACGHAFTYTDEGQLLGHIVLGVEILEQKIRETVQLTGAAFPTELAWRLKHIILSHHGEQSFGSPVVPMTAEAMFVHALDTLDAKVHTFQRDLQDDRGTPSAWTPFIPSLQRRLFKGSRNGSTVSGHAEPHTASDDD
jgi:3'-5' exoribonuclease